MWNPFKKKTPEDYQQELLRLIVKAARRCAYDLAHAVDYMEPGHMKELLRDRPARWLAIFNPADNGKNYRDELHENIRELEREVERLRNLCDENEIEWDDPSLPF